MVIENLPRIDFIGVFKNGHRRGKGEGEDGEGREACAIYRDVKLKYAESRRNHASNYITSYKLYNELRVTYTYDRLLNNLFIDLHLFISSSFNSNEFANSWGAQGDGELISFAIRADHSRA